MNKEIKYPNGDIFVGSTKEGFVVRDSKGQIVFRSNQIKDVESYQKLNDPDKNLFSIEKKDLKNGYGTYTFAAGNMYEGEWKDNLYHGHGTMTYSNGDKYIGEWEEGKYHGKGKYIYADGSVLEGLWESGEIDKKSQEELLIKKSSEELFQELDSIMDDLKNKFDDIKSGK